MTAVIAVLGALRYHHAKQQLLIYDSFYPSNNGAADIFAKMMSSSTANPEKNYLAMPFHHKEIMKIAEELYDSLLKVAVNNTYIPSHLATQTNVIEPNSLNGSVRLTDIKRKSDSTFPLEKRDPYEDSAIVRFEPLHICNIQRK
jgi:hypothetical protein